MSFSISRNGKQVESHATYGQAWRAFWILTAQALKYGLPGDYHFDPVEAVREDIPWAALPDWAVEVLRDEGF